MHSARISRPILWAFTAYFGLLVSLTWARPLWLDEILTLLVNRPGSFSERLATLHQTPGAVPLGFEIERAVMQWLGNSVFAARLPSEIFGVLALAGILLAAREIGTRGLAFVGPVWALLPLILRYAVEARPYALSLLLSVISTVLVFRIQREPRALWVIFFSASVVANLYTQPYSVFLPAGLLIPLALPLRKPVASRSFLLCTGALIVSAVLFLPWVLGSAHNWSVYSAGVHRNPTLTAKLPLEILRELSGGGYVCTLFLLVFVGIGCASRRLDPKVKHQLLTAAACCVVFTLVGDFAFHYFFAIRQIIFVLIPLCLLAGEGWAEAGARWGPYPRLVLLAPLLISALVKDVRHFQDRSENWALAAERLELDSRAGCVAYVHLDVPDLYTFFQPALERRTCSPDPGNQAIFVPVSRYSLPEETRQLVESLHTRGYRREATDRVTEAFEIQSYRR